MSQLRWLLSQPDQVLNQNEVNREFLHADRTMLHPNIIRDAVHGSIIRNEMTKGLDTYSHAVVDEAQDCLKLLWGTDTEQWQEIAVYDTMLSAIGRLSNRALIGLPLCRNKEYLQSSSTFARFVVITAGILNLLPSLIRPILGPMVTAYDMFHYRRMTKYIFPIIEERVSTFQPGNGPKDSNRSSHNDYVHWALGHAFSQNDPIERTPEMITRRLAVLTFGAIQSSVITITNALFDIASSPSSNEIQHELREEVERLSTKCSVGIWKRANLAKMIRIDSALRESMRLWGFLSRGVMKMVMVREGLTIPSGEHLPFGTKVGVTSFAVHHDESIYHNAYEFDAFRFSRPLELPGLCEKGLDGTCNEQKPFPMVASTDSFMGFSHGRHIWYVNPLSMKPAAHKTYSPGRFFAANQLKILLAHITLAYDIEPIAQRPKNPWLNNSIGPPISAKLRVRRRPVPEDPEVGL